MDHLMNWPWREMLLACTFLPGTVATILLLINKYPSSRFLGKLLATNLLFIISLAFHQTYSFVWLTLTAISVVFFLYSRAFFIQNTRINLKHLLPVVLVASISFIPGMEKFQAAVRILVILLVVGYLFASIIFLRKEGKTRGIVWFENPGSRLIWFRNFFGFNIFLILYWLLAFESLYIEQVAAGVLAQLSFVYFQIFKESTFLSPIPLGNKYQKSTLTPEQKYAILSKLDGMLAKEKFYLENNVSLRSLASELNTTTHHLSQVINESKGLSFQELIGKYRIREAKLLLKDQRYKLTKIENIAAMVGYYSKSAFNTAFKKHTGLTPTVFKQSKDVRSYREEPLPDRKKRFFPGFFVSSYHVLLSKIKSVMVKNFLKIFYRTLVRNKIFSTINLFGLTIGFICSILIYLFIADELSYERSLPDYQNIYRISWFSDNPQTRTPHPMAQAMVQHMPEVEAAVSISPWFGAGLSRQTTRVKNVNKDILYEEPDFFFADSTFFDVFDLEVVAGDGDALKKPWNLVITDMMAKKYFGEEDPIGKQLSVNDMPVEIAAVVRGMPDNSHFHFRALMSYVTVKAINPDDPWLTWADFGHFNYVKTSPETDHELLEAKVPNWILAYLDWDDQSIKDLKDNTNRFDLQPISDIHLKSHIRWELENNGNILYVYILVGTLIFILLIISINYVNLTTAKSLERAKEIGIRKTLGARSGNLTIQFYVESFLFCFLALLLAFVFTVALLDSFNYLTGKSFAASAIFNTGFMLKAIILCLVIALLSGFYPALTLNAFIPTQVLKGKFASSPQGNRLRSALVILQFFVSAILIIASLIILKQIEFMRSKELGFDQEAIISIRVHQSVKHGGIDLNQVRGLQNEFKGLSGVRSASAVSNLPGGQFNQNAIYLESDPENRVNASEMYLDFDALEVLNLDIVKGRRFDKSYSDDLNGTNILLNESAIRQLNLKEPIGKSIVWENEAEVQQWNIVGVVKDFHYKSLHQVIQPLIIQIKPHNINHIIVKMEGKHFQKTLMDMEATYKTFENELPFEYHFLDQQLADLYSAEVRTLNIFSIFAAIALFLACLGLLGIAMAILHQKIKEVGIRKIMGASSQQIITMIMGKFTRLIAIALALGLPVGYILMQKWIGEFSYQVAIGILPFLLAAFILLAVAIASVSMVVLKIAYANPADALQNE